MADISSINRERKKKQLKQQMVTNIPPRMEPELDNEDELRAAQKRSRKRRLILLVVLLLVAGGCAFGVYHYQRYYQFTSLDIAWERNMEEGSFVGYKNFGSNVLKYTKDGASYIDNQGKDVWSQSYEMKTPIVSVSGGYAAIADQQGNSIYICDKNGYQGTATTLLPILRVAVSQNGVVAAILEDSTSNYITFFRKDGSALDLTIKTKMSGNGFPEDISLSPDGTQLICSYTYLTNGEVRGRVVFYDFSEIGKNVPNRLVAGYDDPFASSIVARVRFLSGVNSVAFANDSIAFFSSKNLASPEMIKQIAVEEKIQSVTYSDEYVGIIVATDGGQFPNRLDVYKKDGTPVFSKEFDYQYRHADIDGDLVLLYNEESCKVFNMSGVEKLSTQFDYTVSKITKGRYPNTLIVTGPQTMKEFKLH